MFSQVYIIYVMIHDDNRELDGLHLILLQADQRNEVLSKVFDLKKNQLNWYPKWKMTLPLPKESVDYLEMRFGAI